MGAREDLMSINDIIQKTIDRPVPQIMVHPDSMKRAARLLGYPEDTPLTVGEFYRAAQIEMEQAHE